MRTDTPSATSEATPRHTEFALTDEYRDQLNSVAREHYAAHNAGDTDRASDLADDLYDEPWGIGGGAGRIVIPLPWDAYAGGEHDEYVVKLAIPACEDAWGGTEQNQREAALWNGEAAVSPELRAYLVPVTAVDPDGYWLIMPRGDRVDSDSQEFWEWRSDAKYELRGTVWKEDVKARNTVTVNGDYRLCDYGVATE